MGMCEGVAPLSIEAVECVIVIATGGVVVVVGGGGVGVMVMVMVVRERVMTSGVTMSAEKVIPGKMGQLHRLRFLYLDPRPCPRRGMRQSQSSHWLRPK